MHTVPHRIETERLMIRRYLAADAEALASAISRNLDHLRRYMEWVAFEPQGVEQRRAWVTQVDAKADAGEDFTLGMFLRDSAATGGALVGGTGFHVRTDPDRLAIGYWIDAAHEGRGLVTEAAAALAHVGLTLAGATLLDISHAPSNARSAAVPQRLGFERQDASGEQCFDAATRSSEHPGCVDGDAKVSATMWWATRETLGREPLASWPRPRAFDGNGAEMAWPA